MISLFIDTSMSSVSISIVRDDIILALIQKDIPNMHSVYVTKFVKDALDQAGIDANSVDNIMVVNGPGSFTGVRIGVTIAKTYGFLINKDIIPISSLKSLAISSNYKGIIMSMIPANKTSYYVGIYDSNYEILENERCVNKEEVLGLLNKYHPYVVSVNQDVIAEYKINKQEIDVLKVVKYYMNGERISHHKLVPNYLKLPQALEGKK